MEYSILILSLLLLAFVYPRNRLILVFLYPMSNWLRVGVTIPGFTTVYFIDVINLLCLLIILEFFIIKRRTLTFNRLDFSILLLAALFYAYIALGMNHDTARVFYEKVMLLPEFIAFLIIIEGSKNYRRALRYYLLSYLMLLLLGIVAFFAPGLFSRDFIESIKYTYNFTALRFTLFQPASYIAIFALFFMTERYRYLLIPALFVLELFSGGRTETIVFVVAVGYYFLYRSRLQVLSRRKRAKLAFVNYGIVLALILGVYVGANYLEETRGYLPAYLVRYYQLITNPQYAAENRFGYLDYSLISIQKNLIFGNEIYSAKNLMNSGVGLVETSALSGRTHNNFIAVTYAFGIFGLALYLLMIYQFFRSVFKVRPIDPGSRTVKYVLLLLLIAMFIRSFSTGDYYNFFVYPPIAAIISSFSKRRFT